MTGTAYCWLRSSLQSSHAWFGQAHNINKLSCPAARPARADGSAINLCRDASISLLPVVTQVVSDCVLVSGVCPPCVAVAT